MLGCALSDVNFRFAEIAAWERGHLARKRSHAEDQRAGRPRSQGGSVDALMARVL